jgi:hypothetical protein
MPRPIKVGKNRQRVTLRDVPESLNDSWSQPSQAPTTIGVFWMEVMPLEGSEILNVRQIWPTATHRVNCRWLGSAIPSTPDNPNQQIVPSMEIQLELDNSILKVLFAENIEKRNRAWSMICAEHVGATA